MNQKDRRRFLVLCGLLSACATAGVVPTPRSDWSAVDAALGKTGTLQPGNVYKVSFPRSDLDVRVGDVRLRPALALGSWVAFLDAGQGAMTMGDLVLTEREVNDVISTMQAGGIEQTALHNHVMAESPRVMYLHFSGHGDATSLASTLRAALLKTGTPMDAGSGTQPPVDLPTLELDRILGTSGKSNGGVYQFSVARRERIIEHGIEVPPAAGMATAINFQSTGNGRAAIAGDFVMTATEVNEVIRALRSGGIEITALHSHMLEEQPRLFFMHFWAEDDAVKLAQTLRTALDRTNASNN